MLLEDFLGYALADDYANFISYLKWYRMFCAGEMGQEKNDYIKGFQDLKFCYGELRTYEKEIPEWISKPVVNLLTTIQTILDSERVTGESIVQLGNLLWEFESKEERRFRDRYFNWRLAEDALRDYPQGLYNAVDTLLIDGKTDEAIIAAFKYLDRHIQSILGLSPHQYHGEDLINFAFAPNAGALQLGTHPNEQIGLRNLFSGANALFRNPAAHRVTKYDLFSAATVVAMVAVMSQIASDIAAKKEKTD